MMSPKVKSNIIEITIGIVLTAFVIWLQFTNHVTISSFAQRLENIAYDLRYKSTLPLKSFKKTPIIIVDIDEKSLKNIGRWPWPRKTTANLNDKLFKSGAAVIGYDVIFSEPQRNVADQFVNFLQEENKIPDNWQETVIPDAKRYFNEDKILASSFSNGEVSLGFLLHSDGENVGELPPPIALIDEFDSLRLLKTNNYTSNLPMIQHSAISSGFTVVVRDMGGIVRQAPIVMQHEDKIYGSLSLEVAKSYLLANSVSLKTSKIGGRDTIEAVLLDNIEIPTNGLGQALIPFRGKRGSFPYISASDILNDNNNIDLAGKIVLVGTSALGLSDLHATTIQSVFPGIEVHANVIAGILEQNFPMKPAWAAGANLLQLFLIGLVLSILFPFLGPILILVVSSLITVLVVGANIWLWVSTGFVLTITTPVLLIILLLMANTAYGFVFESRKKRQITQMFGQYVSSDIVDEMSKDPEHYNFDGQTKEMTVLFSDIRGFTSLSENLIANDLKNLLNSFFSPMTEIIFNQGGTIDKYVGDMVMAFWGAPKDDPNQANNSVIAGLKMLDKTEKLTHEFAKLNLPKVTIGIGVNTGSMHVGDMGSKYRRSYTVLGDAVNLGSRLEGLTKFYGVKMVIGSNTFKKLDGIVCKQLDLVKVKGKKKSEAIYEPIGYEEETGDKLKIELDKYNLALKTYFSRDFDKAKEMFLHLQEENSSIKLYSLYVDRIIDFEKNPPPEDWDGSYTRTEK